MQVSQALCGIAEAQGDGGQAIYRASAVLDMQLRQHVCDGRGQSLFAPFHPAPVLADRLAERVIHGDGHRRRAEQATKYCVGTVDLPADDMMGHAQREQGQECNAEQHLDPADRICGRCEQLVGVDLDDQASADFGQPSRATKHHAARGAAVKGHRDVAARGEQRVDAGDERRIGVGAMDPPLGVRQSRILARKIAGDLGGFVRPLIAKQRLMPRGRAQSPATVDDPRVARLMQPEAPQIGEQSNAGVVGHAENPRPLAGRRIAEATTG